jgi:hypothetical protein
MKGDTRLLESRNRDGLFIIARCKIGSRARRVREIDDVNFMPEPGKTLRNRP